MLNRTRLKQVPTYLMENQSERTVHVHYNHTDSCKNSRWTARESYQFMYNRPWNQVVDFYSDVVNGRTLLSALFGTECRELSPQMHPVCDDNDIVEASKKSEPMNIPTEDRGGRWARVTFKIFLSYHGGSFDGWQKQPGLNTVQGLVERSLGKFVDERKAQQLKDKGSPIEGIAVVAGRTDKGVSALQQVCSFYTWRKDVKSQDVVHAIDEAAPGKLKVVSVAEVSRVFHPNFCAKWRRYLYVFPLNIGEEGEQSSAYEDGVEDMASREHHHSNRRYKLAECSSEEVLEESCDDVGGKIKSEKKPTKFKISKVDQLLCQLEGKLLSYKMFARDTKASRNIGPPTECFMYHARSSEAQLPCHDKDRESVKAMCVELVANRFLRKMVRVLVATAVREAAAGAEDDALIKLMDATCRRATAPPAPPDGLCLVDVGYAEFDPKICLIP
ncbi:tRNA pseudouridine(38-40) synthase [Bertholletia excelsa]